MVFFFIHWSRLKMHKLPPAKNCSSISSEIQWIFMVRCPCKTTKEAARDWKEKKDYMKNKKKTLKICFNFHTEKLWVSSLSILKPIKKQRLIWKMVWSWSYFFNQLDKSYIQSSSWKPLVVLLFFDCIHQSEIFQCSKNSLFRNQFNDKVN